MSKHAKETCFQDLKARILATDLLPGSALDEMKLAEHYGMSRTPMREILQRLAGAGYAVIEENRGAKVAPMDLVTMRVFFQTAPMVYAGIARQAAENRSSAQLDALKAAQMHFTKANAAGDAGGAALANHGFHEIIGEMAANPYLMAALSRMLIDHARLSQTFYRPQSDFEATLVTTAQCQHDQMIAAIEARDVELVTELTLAHWDLSKDRMERFVRPDPLPLDVAQFERT